MKLNTCLLLTLFVNNFLINNGCQLKLFKDYSKSWSWCQSHRHNVP